MATVNIVQMLTPQHKMHIKGTYPMTPQYITIHNTANRASAKAEISYMIRNDNYTSYHYAVDDVGAIQGLPLDRNGWHCGDGSNGTGNRQSIGIEICYSIDSSYLKYSQAENNGAILTAMLLKQFGWGIDRVRKHQDWSGKYCPHRILERENGWQEFLNKVQRYLDELNGVHVKKEPQLQVGLKPIEEVAKEVINGKWGNGKHRIQNLSQAGYNVQSVQAKVDELLGKPQAIAENQKPFSMVSETGKFTVTDGPILVKNEPYVKSPKVAQYENGESMNYDSYTICDGHVWISYISYSGVRRYVPVGEHNGKRRVSCWGTFE